MFMYWTSVIITLVYSFSPTNSRGYEKKTNKSSNRNNNDLPNWPSELARIAIIRRPGAC